ncbi:MAG: hypothetical protein C1943_07730 [Halochromatium sp.]|nr:hypothetical protein [Halochromatium sp.]
MARFQHNKEPHSERSMHSDIARTDGRGTSCTLRMHLALAALAVFFTTRLHRDNVLFPTKTIDADHA